MEQLNPGYSPPSATTSSSKLLYSRSAVRGEKMHPLIGLLNCLHLTNLQVFEEFPARCKPFLPLLSLVPITLQSPILLLLPCTRPGYCSFTLPRWLAGGEGVPESPGEIPCSQVCCPCPNLFERSNWREKPIWFLDPWRCCILTNHMGRAPDQRRQVR